MREAIGRVLALPPGVEAIIDGDTVREVRRETDEQVLATDL